MKILALILAIVVTVGAFTFIAVDRLLSSDQLDTETHSYEVAGYYGIGRYGDELLESDTIITNITEGNMSQSINFQGAVCQRLAGLGKVFLDGAKSTEPDAQYKIYVNDMLQYAFNIEMGSSSVINGCIDLPKKEFVLSGQNTGRVQVEMHIFVFDFARGAGSYKILALDRAKLT